VNTLKNTNVPTLNTNMNSLDAALKRYFKFSDNNQAISDRKIFENVFTGVNPNLELLSRVVTANGLTIRTSIDNINNKNLKICNNDNKCVNMNVNDSTFNITPENVTVLNINSNINPTTFRPMARFNLQNNTIDINGNLNVSGNITGNAGSTSKCENKTSEWNTNRDVFPTLDCGDNRMITRIAQVQNTTTGSVDRNKWRYEYKCCKI
jgi:hypothetical protein